MNEYLDKFAGWRAWAESALQGQAVDSPTDLEQMSPQDAQRLIHELWGQRVELEMQNAELRRVQAELEVSCARYSDLFESAQQGIIIAAPDGKILSANPAAASLFGYDCAAEMVGLPGAEFYQQTQHKERLFKELQNKGYIKDSGPLLFTRKDGSSVYLTGNAIARKNSAGDILHIEGIFTDASRQVQTERILRRRNRELELLNHASQVFNSTLNLGQMLATALEEVRRLLGVHACSVWLNDDEGKGLLCHQAAGPRSELVRGWRLAPGEGIAGWVVQHGKPLNVPDTRSDERHYKNVNGKTGLELRSILSVPLRIWKETVGVLQLGDVEVGRFDADYLELAESLAAVASMAIENARFYEQARQDAATKSTLLREVNHRVKNNLTSIMGLLYATRNHSQVTDQAAFEAIINDLVGRVRGLATVHSMLSSSGWAPLRLSDLAQRIIRSSLQACPRDKQVSVQASASPVYVSPSQAHNLALVINELATNTVKHALVGRDKARISFQISFDDDGPEPLVCCELRDDGPGYPADVLRLERHNVGLYLVQSIVNDSLHGKLALRNQGGAVTEFRFRDGV
jgi:PAS domain S-box-containing protein